ncbi:MAG: PD-(D/E)XK nuclease family protein [Bacteroidales bacterium]
MTSFLNYTANYLINKHKADFQNVVVLMPNRRSCIFLEHELARMLTHTAWLPQIISLNDWLNSKASLNKIDELLAIVKLYYAFNQVYTDKNIRFDEFYYTGQILLNDFNDIDSELVDAEKLFVNLHNLKEISEHFALDDEFFNILSSYIFLFEKNLSIDKTDEESTIQSYIKIWQGLFELYKTFRNNLIKDNYAYDGLLIRYFIENDFEKRTEIDSEIYYIIGFNALSRAEERLFELLQNRTTCFFLWEYDDEYIQNEQYSAGLYLRRLIKKFPLPNDFNLSTTNLSNNSINILALPNEISMVKYAVSMLTDTVEKTAVVLADESLLPVVLNSLPDNIGKVNVTMGFPVKQTETYLLIKLLFKLRQQIRYNKDETWIPRNVWIELLYHSFILDDPFAKKQIKVLIDEYKGFNAYIEKSALFKEATNDSILSKLYDLCIDTSNSSFLSLLLQLFQYLETKLLHKNIEVVEIQLEIQALRKVFNAFSAFNDMFINNRIEINDIKLFHRLLNQILHSLKIDLFGEPLEGLQIMGFMESRLLDFEKVFVLSLNDKIIPGDKFTPTFILYSLRKYFGLPTHEKREAIDAFLFYRLIQRSSQSYLFYSQFIGSDEADKSPYLRQLLFNSKWNITEKIYNDKIGQSPQINPIEIDKNSLGEKWEFFLKNIYEKGLSQKAISTFIQCPLKFYFEQIEQLKDEALFPDESIEKDFGLLFHEAIKRLFKDKKHVNKEELKEIQSQIPETVEQIFQEKYQYPWAQVLLLKEQLKSLLYKFFETETQENSHFPCEIISIEQDFETIVNKIKLFGRIDMILKNSNGTYIIDFKTGSEKEVSFENLDELFVPNSKLSYAFQLAFYSYLYSNKYQNVNNLYAENIYVKSYNQAFKKILSQKVIKEGQKKFQKENIDFTTILEAFERKIKEKLDELLDMNHSFTQTSDVKNCEYCNFNLICRKKIIA